MSPSPGDNALAPVEDDDEATADAEFSSGHSVVVTAVNAVMAAMTFGAVASMVMALGRLLR